MVVYLTGLGLTIQLSVRSPRAVSFNKKTVVMPEKTKSEINDYLDDNYYDAQTTGGSSGHLRDQWANIHELIAPIENQRILDIGCGSGKYAASMSHKAYPTAIDFSPVAMQLTRKTISEQGKLDRSFIVQSRGEELPFASASYDKVTALDIVEHINQEEYEKLVVEVLRVLKPGGIFCIYTPNKTYSIEFVYKLIFGRSLSPLHFGLKTSSELLAPLNALGFEVLDTYYKPNYLPVLRQIEQVLMPLPLVGTLARRRINIRAKKPLK
jgi:ubiquinone/menaquinone biosynthesis C-methylase UbiE